MELIDSHAHLDFADFRDDLDSVLQRAWQIGVEQVVTVGLERERSQAADALAVAARNERLFATVGVHPHDAALQVPWSTDARAPLEAAMYAQWQSRRAVLLPRLRSLALHPKVVAIGEAGLDYHYDHSPRELQRALFRDLIGLARERRLPLVVHSREADEDTVRILEQEGAAAVGGVIHCYTGSPTLATAARALGFHLGIGGVLTYRNTNDLQRQAAEFPLERLLLETDCPYLSPVPHRGQRNEPAYVVEVARALGTARGVSVEQIAQVTSNAARQLFGLKTPRGRVVYALGSSLYLNLTNRCTLACTFCLKRRGHSLGGIDLALAREPTATEVIGALGCHDASTCDEVVFCGIGEPLLRLDEVRGVAQWLKQQRLRVRINSDGLAALVHGRDVASELRPFIDAWSISLNAADAASYARLCPSIYGERAYAAVCDFLRRLAQLYPPGAVVATAVAVPGLDPGKVSAVARGLGVAFRLRSYSPD